MQSSKLSFDIIDTSTCRTLAIMDTSVYQSLQVIANPTLQVISPFDDEPVQLDYYRNGITVLNSNNLGITNVNDFDYLVDLPDGLYTIKISICPEDIYWFEKSWYRTCQLECKYDQAFLKLNVSSCDVCYSTEKVQKLERARLYIYGEKNKEKNCNNKEADRLYKGAEKILTNLLLCDCGGK